MTRPSHTIPRDVFDAILDLEQAARADATFYATVGIATGQHDGDEAAEYLRLVATTGAKRDQLATLILESFEREDAEVGR